MLILGVQGLVANQARELEDVHKVFSEESTKLAKLWRGRVKEYERSFARSVEEFRALHQEQQQVLIDQMHTKVQNPRPSKVGAAEKAPCRHKLCFPLPLQTYGIHLGSMTTHSCTAPSAHRQYTHGCSWLRFELCSWNALVLAQICIAHMDALGSDSQFVLGLLLAQIYSACSKCSWLRLVLCDLGTLLAQICSARLEWSWLRLPEHA
eukprot:518164-Pelagomonas_calceolata.AAC.1